MKSWFMDQTTGRFTAQHPVDLLFASTTFGAGCWEWSGEKNSKGYGRVALTRDGQRTRILAHKVAFEDAYGPVPDGMIIRHRCDNKACVRWSHLTYGTYSQNAYDAVKRGQIKSGPRFTHCKVGHPFSAENTYRWTSEKTGRTIRTCKECARRRNRHGARKRTGALPARYRRAD